MGSTSADIATPTKDQLERATKKANEQVEGQFPTEGVQLMSQVMCGLFNVLPGTKANEKPDYWTAFLDAILNPKLLFQLEQFKKDRMSSATIRQVVEACAKEQFATERLKEDVRNLPI